MRLDGKIVVVTGASSGIGQALALGCAREGADLAITYRGNEAGARETAAQIIGLGRRAQVTRVDISRDADVEALAQAVAGEFGHVDVWINNAGADILTGSGGRLTLREKLDLLLAVDVRGTIVASWAAAKMMAERGGVILNVSWDHVGFGMAGENPILYSAAKGAIMSFSKSLARQVAPRVRVNILAPGFIETAFGEQADSTWRREVEARTPLRRWGAPDDLVGAALFLASDESRFVTGSQFKVDAGSMLKF